MALALQPPGDEAGEFDALELTLLSTGTEDDLEELLMAGGDEEEDERGLWAAPARGGAVPLGSAGSGIAAAAPREAAAALRCVDGTHGAECTRRAPLTHVRARALGRNQAGPVWERSAPLLRVRARVPAPRLLWLAARLATHSTWLTRARPVAGPLWARLDDTDTVRVSSHARPAQLHAAARAR
jgi:hypothetical protein